MAATKTANKHPLVGAGLHFKDKDGAVQNQASIEAVIPSGGPAGDLAFIDPVFRLDCGSSEHAAARIAY